MNYDLYPLKQQVIDETPKLLVIRVLMTEISDLFNRLSVKSSYIYLNEN